MYAFFSSQNSLNHLFLYYQVPIAAIKKGYYMKHPKINILLLLRDFLLIKNIF